MAKKPVSLTLDESNLVWLRGLTARSAARSLSETVDRLITSARARGVAAKATQSVVGTIGIPAADPALDHADATLRDLCARSLIRTMLAQDPRTPIASGRRRRG
jgi:hypothetical protein